jgi:hypothetical protein
MLRFQNRFFLIKKESLFFVASFAGTKVREVQTRQLGSNGPVSCLAFRAAGLFVFLALEKQSKIFAEEENEKKEATERSD